MKNPVLPETFALPIVSPPETNPSGSAATPAPLTQTDSGHSGRSDDLQAAADREIAEGARYDAAILQAVREHVWGVLSSHQNPDTIAKIVPLIISARKQAMAERSASGPSSSDRPDPILEKLIDPELQPSLRAARARPPL